MVAACGLRVLRPPPPRAAASPGKAVDPTLSALTLLPRFAADVAGADGFVHRNYTALFASVPVVAIGSIATFLLKDRLGGSRTSLSALGSLPADSALPLRPDEELALAGVALAMMAERLEHDPAAYPLLAAAAARLVPESAHSVGRHGWTGLTERARRAAVDVLRPLALATLVRAATWEPATGERT